MILFKTLFSLLSLYHSYQLEFFFINNSHWTGIEVRRHHYKRSLYLFHKEECRQKIVGLDFISLTINHHREKEKSKREGPLLQIREKASGVEMTKLMVTEIKKIIQKIQIEKRNSKGEKKKIFQGMESIYRRQKACYKKYLSELESFYQLHQGHGYHFKEERSQKKDIFDLISQGYKEWWYDPSPRKSPLIF